MKKLWILFVFCIFVLSSCTNQYDAYKVIEKDFPNSDIIQIEQYKFIVIDSTGVYYIKCMSLKDGRITTKQMVKKWQSQ
jgi:thioredoxin-related protein